MFIGRKNELMKLNNMYQFDNFEFAVIYGRRRVGKSTLIQKFCEGKKFIYYVSIQGSKKDNLQGLSSMILQHIMPNKVVPSFASYEDLFDFIDTIIDERIIITIDEYPYLVESDASLSLIIQKHIDLKWKYSKLMFILCESSMSFMENQVLGYKSPLYGRRSAQFKVQPFAYHELKELCWKYTPKEMAVLYAITGGVGEYLSFINPLLEDLIEQGDLFSKDNKYFYLFAKNGFTDYVIEEANANPNIYLVSIEDIYIDKDTNPSIS